MDEIRNNKEKQMNLPLNVLISLVIKKKDGFKAHLAGYVRSKNCESFVFEDSDGDCKWKFLFKNIINFEEI